MSWSLTEDGRAHRSSAVLHEVAGVEEGVLMMQQTRPVISMRLVGGLN